TNNEDDTINLATNGTYTFTTVADMADNGNALPSILPDQPTNNSPGHTLTINGNGATLTRTGSVQMRFFRLTQPFLVPATLILNDATLTNGSAPTSVSNVAGNGGAIAINIGGNALLTNCNLVNNQATGDGGAIWTFSAGSNSLILDH